MKKSIHSCPLRSQTTHMFVLEPFWTVLACKRCLICADFSPDSRQDDFFTGQLWIMDTYFSWNQQFEVRVSYWWICLLQTQLLSSPDVNWWTGVVWIIVMFLSAVWTLILTAPIHCRASIAETLMQWHFSKSDEETNSSISWMTWEWGHFQHLLNFFFWVKLFIT